VAARKSLTSIVVDLRTPAGLAMKPALMEGFSPKVTGTFSIGNQFFQSATT
jgi:hypothetical protein